MAGRAAKRRMADPGGEEKLVTGARPSPWIGAEIERIPPRDLISDPRNARTHTDRQVRQIADAILAFGFTSPVLVDAAGVIIAGHARTAAAVSLGLSVVPCIRVAHLDDAQRRALAIADNRLALSAGWDTDVLGDEVAELERLGIDLSLLGFDADELADLLPPGASDAAHVADEHPALTTTQPGDVWALGRHRVMCGSCDDADAVRRLAPDGWDGAVVDPPYERDDLPGLTDPSIVFGQAKHIRLIPADLWRFERVLDKVQGHRSATVQVLHRHAFVAQVGSVRQLPRDPSATYDSIVRVDSSQRGDHPHAKPVDLLVEHMEAWWPPGIDRVADLCAGSGSTLLACEQTGRTAYLMEIDPATVDGIVSRWIESGGPASVESHHG
jgi:hypothetical protein